MAVIHISQADALRDFAAVLDRVRGGTEVVIDDAPAAVKLSIAATRSGRLLSEMIALAEERSTQSNVEAVMDENFAADLEEIIRQRAPRDTSAWD